MAKRMYAFGMDGLILPMVRYFAREGSLPAFARLMAEGTHNQTFCSFPVWTPTNWATLSTGAHTGTHQVSTWETTLPSGEDIDSFDGRSNRADRIWNALERAGLKGTALHYPGAFPSGAVASTILDGLGHPGHAHTEFEVAACQAYETGSGSDDFMIGHDGAPVAGSRSIQGISGLTMAVDWRNLPASHKPPLETEIAIVSRFGNTSQRYSVLVTASAEAYDRVHLAQGKDGNRIVASAGTREWTDWLVDDFAVPDGSVEAALRFKVMELDPGGNHLKLYRSQVTHVHGYSYGDTELEDLLRERFGPYQEHASMIPYTSGMTDFATALEECAYQGNWFAEVGHYMLTERDSAYFTCHWHLYDYLNHIHLADVDPVCPGFDPARKEEHMEMFRQAYRVGDRIIARMQETQAELAGDDVYVGVLADHGAYPDVRVVNVRKFLCDTGFLVLRDGEAAVAEDQDRLSDDQIDWTRTKAYLRRRGFDITINAERGSDRFNEIERELLTALRTWMDEETGQTVVAIALPRRDAYILGQWGDQCGDVVFVYEHDYVSGYYPQWKGIVGGGNVGAPLEFGAHHGGFLPTDNGFSSTFGSFLIAGPGLKQDYERDTEQLGYIHAADVVPTLCRILGIEPPQQSQGTVARDLWEGFGMSPGSGG